MGEPGGIGGELTLKAWRALSGGDTCFFVIDDPARLERLGAEVATIASPAEAPGVFASRLPVLDIGAAIDVAPGRAEPENAAHVIASIERAVALALSGEAGGVVTNPIQKSALIAAGFPFPGHTEFLGELTKAAPMPGARRRGPIMMLSGRDLRTVPVTIHMSLAKAAATLTSEAIVHAGLVTAESLARDFSIDRPRLAIAGLNPHAGEAGALGAEDETIVAPAVAALRRAGIEARGPLPADTMFHESARAGYDAALCMYHDQALIPIKTIAFHDAVNVTLGLPIIRTSPDHGTALDIAGAGVARPDSLIAAIRLAAEMAARRAGAPR
jgi:4-hydroxythreonine-4-phosphate dehydrogenase